VLVQAWYLLVKDYCGSVTYTPTGIIKSGAITAKYLEHIIMSLLHMVLQALVFKEKPMPK
jgi:hypothetical protein